MADKPASVADYLASLPAPRREAVETVRKVLLDNLGPDYEEGIQYGMIGYYVPHRVHPAGYHCDPKQPLPFAALGSNKSGLSLHLMVVYGDEALDAWFRSAWAKTGKKLDMGKACLRFKSADDLALDVIAELLRRFPARAYIERCEKAIAAYKATKAAKSAATKEPASKPKAAPAKKASAAKPKGAPAEKAAAKPKAKSPRGKG